MVHFCRYLVEKCPRVNRDELQIRHHQACLGNLLEARPPYVFRAQRARVTKAKIIFVSSGARRSTINGSSDLSATCLTGGSRYPTVFSIRQRRNYQTRYKVRTRSRVQRYPEKNKAGTRVYRSFHCAIAVAQMKFQCDTNNHQTKDAWVI